MTVSRPLLFRWQDDGKMTPLSPSLADKQYCVGEAYRLVPYEDRSANSHNHFFAAVHDAWQNLPEGEADRYPSSEHLRKWALVKTGYCDKEDIVCASNVDSLKLASYARTRDHYAVIQVANNVVTIWTAQSQSRAAMGKEIFQKSKTAVLDEISKMIGVSTDDLQRNAGQAA